MIHLCDLTKQPKEIMGAVEEVLKSGRFVKGPLVEKFEKEWAKRCGTEYAVGVSSGALALELATFVLFQDQETVTYSHYTFKAVPNAICRMGKEAIGVENKMCPDIYAHHLHEMPPTYIPPLEDCSHAHGYRPLADTAIFSLFPTKILGAAGDAGVIVTNERWVYDQCSYLRSHGIPFGTNARMDEVQAAVLLAKLPFLDSDIKRRREIALRYDAAFDRETAGEFNYAYTIPGSSENIEKLKKLGIESAFYYDEEHMALPLHPHLTDSEVEYVISSVKNL